MRIERKTATGMPDIIKAYLKVSRLATGLNTVKVFEAWDQASGAASYTQKKYFRDGKLYVTLSSSVVRSSLIPQRLFIIQKINEILRQDELFVRDDPNARFVEDIILK